MSLRRLSQKYVPPEPRVADKYPPAPSNFTLQRLEDGSFGPLGIYGKRVQRTKLLDLFRNAIKPARIARIEQVLLQRCTRVTVVLENLVDPANGSACIRTCEGLGLNSVHIIESYEPFRTSAGITRNADKWVTTYRYNHFVNAINCLKDQGYTLVATCLDDDAIPIDKVDFASMDKIAIMLGNEERGLSGALRECADVKACIPMCGMTQSLNISTTCGIFVHHLRMQGLLSPDLTDEEMTRLYTRWIVQSTKNATTLLAKHGFAGEMKDYM